MMIGRKSFHRIAMVLAAGLSLAACSTWSYSPPMRGTYNFAQFTVPRLQATQPAPGISAFNLNLARDYASFSDSLLHTDKDWADADYFARKGMAAAKGQVVPPENPGNWLIATPQEAPVGFDKVLNDARQRLTGYLDANRDRNPQVSARAQVLYDCWVEHTEQSWWTAMNGPCRADLMKILGDAPAANTANVYFGFNQSTLTPEAMQVVQHVADAAKGDPNLRIVLVGKTDLAGTDAYNMELSHRRADAVRTVLRNDGVDNTRIDERWVGKRQPPVPTPDGVREPRNRVVEITIQ